MCLQIHGNPSSFDNRCRNFWFLFVTNRHTEFEVDTVKHMRLMFYIEGPENKGTVHVEAKQVVIRVLQTLLLDQLHITFKVTESTRKKILSKIILITIIIIYVLLI